MDEELVEINKELVEINKEFENNKYSEAKLLSIVTNHDINAQMVALTLKLLDQNKATNIIKKITMKTTKFNSLFKKEVHASIFKQATSPNSCDIILPQFKLLLSLEEFDIVMGQLFMKLLVYSKQSLCLELIQAVVDLDDIKLIKYFKPIILYLLENLFLLTKEQQPSALLLIKTLVGNYLDFDTELELQIYIALCNYYFMEKNDKVMDILGLLKIHEVDSKAIFDATGIIGK